MYKLANSRRNRAGGKLVRQFFDCYVLCDLEYWSNGPATFRFNECEKNDIQILFEKRVNEFYSIVRRDLDKVVFSELWHYGEYCYSKLEGIKINRIRKMRDAWTANYIFSKGKWDENYGGPLWGSAASFLLKHPQSIHEKMSWIDKVMDLQHNNGQVFSGKRLPISWVSEWETLHSEDLCDWISPLDLRAEGDMPSWLHLCSPEVYTAVKKYVNKIKNNYKGLK